MIEVNQEDLRHRPALEDGQLIFVGNKRVALTKVAQFQMNEMHVTTYRENAKHYTVECFEIDSVRALYHQLTAEEAMEKMAMLAEGGPHG